MRPREASACFYLYTLLGSKARSPRISSFTAPLGQNGAVKLEMRGERAFDPSKVYK